MERSPARTFIFQPWTLFEKYLPSALSGENGGATKEFSLPGLARARAQTPQLFSHENWENRGGGLGARFPRDSTGRWKIGGSRIFWKAFSRRLPISFPSRSTLATWGQRTQASPISADPVAPCSTRLFGLLGGREPRFGRCFCKLVPEIEAVRLLLIYIPSYIPPCS